VDPDVLAWLLRGDPAVAWQTQRDLLDSPEKEWEATQRLVATEGWGKRLMSEREPGGRWDGGLYSPKWTSTTYTLLQLWRLGLPLDNPQARESVALLMSGRIWAPDRGEEVILEECVAGFALALSSWFTIDDRERDRLVTEILARQMDDGGWNCRASKDRAVTHSSFHTSMNVLEGLNEYRLSEGKHSGEVEVAEVRAREFFCQHRMYRSHRTGAVPDARMGRLPFPPHWHHDVLRGLDYFRASGAGRDHRLESAIDRVNGYRDEHGKWPIHQGYSGKVWFNMEAGRSPSRWNTLRALRVMRWWGSA
jgi:hypothetical protein